MKRDAATIGASERAKKEIATNALAFAEEELARPGEGARGQDEEADRILRNPRLLPRSHRRRHDIYTVAIGSRYSVRARDRDATSVRRARLCLVVLRILGDSRVKYDP